MEKSSKTDKQEKISKVVVIGTSAGGLSALKKLIRQLSKDFPIPVLVVRHISPDATGNALIDELNKLNTVTCRHAKHGNKLKPGYLYLAPSDHHLLIGENLKMQVTKGAHENRSRPAIDPLFRSAAVAFGPGVIGILLTGYLDDGTSGMKAIKKCGGTCIVQDPEEAEYPDMPRNALNNVEVDYILPISKMGDLLHKIIPEKLQKNKPVPKDILIEAEMARLEKGVGSKSALETAEKSQTHIDRIRAILKTAENKNGDDMPI